jgi:hypothetical protein
MPNHVCWLCKSNTGHTLSGDPTFLGPEVAPPNASGKQVVCAPLRCTICNGQSIALGTVGLEYSNARILQTFFENARGDELRWRPSATDSHSYPNVPEHIAEAATEAYECNSCEHYRGAIMLARAVIEATAKDNAITTGTLFSKIEALATAGLIRSVIKDAAHGVRELGNEMAHGDFVDPISPEESQLVIRLMGEILNDVYQSPASIAQAQQAAQTRRQRGQQ